MKKVSEVEILSLTGILKMENDAVIAQRAINTLITDEDLKRQGEASVLAAEGRIKALKKFIEENQEIIVREE
ncbi:hypothetical protein BH721_10930 [Clostridium baratii]|uniref:Uncharacterized protein n=1 Tax=Clostridium baratii TaxID=1561 RepID=A0A174PS33_9CLOT|nr:hypothetical protein [Clostridium baratii]OPF51975.1 hypothetical protein A1M12_05440 [Clostridium baratii]OPF53619.1 hypothetical protein BH721_10930 [Clostridium baratii]OPF56448.1 hypothetical protein BH724_11605 [Clostridium baratii]OPF60666.1 hypothetical protein BH725_08895 [Clostridium baratii]CUP61610.1 Uncharacterised protein [Clostridium baratii]